MKRFLRILSAAISAIIISAAVPWSTAAAYYGDFAYSVIDGTVTITDYTGDSAKVEIPSEIGGLPVTSIGYRAFSGCSSLTSITIPDSVTSIGDDAFFRCESLTSITIPDSVTSIGDDAFFGCNSLTNIDVDINNMTYASVDGVLFSKDMQTLIQYPAGKTDTYYTIPDSVISIGYRAFFGCSSLTSITIPDSVTSIGRWAFYDTAYYNDEANWDNDVLYIGNHLIDNNASSDNCTIRKGVKTIADSAFANCERLTNITIPDSVTSIGVEAFSCCYNLTGITIPDSVTRISVGAFFNCSSLTSITIPDSVTSIGDDAFFGCNSLASITIPDGVTSIGDEAFDDCSRLASITIPDSVTSIGYGAFFRCNSLTNIDVDINNSAYASVDGVLFSKNMQTLIQYPAKKTDTYYTIPDSVTSIGICAFYRCYNLMSITIPDGRD